MIDRLMWLVAVGSLVGTIANVHQRRWCFLIWGCSNVAWICYDVYKTAYPQAALMAVYAGLAVWGWFKWGNGKGGDHAEGCACGTRREQPDA